MDTNLLLCLIVGLNCAVGLIRMRATKQIATRGWMFVFAGVLLALVIAYAIEPDSAGYWVAPVWSIVILVPILSARAVSVLIVRGNYGLGNALAHLAAWTHPYDGWTLYPRFVLLNRCLHDGRLEEAKAIAAEVRDRKTPFSRAAQVLSVGVTADWQSYLDWMETSGDRELLLQDPSTLSGYLASLGRTGRHAEMMEAYREHAAPLAARGGAVIGAILRTTLFTQLGRTEPLKSILEGPLASFPPPIKELYFAESEFVRGDRERGVELAERVLGTDDAGVAVHLRARRLLDDPPPTLDEAALGESGAETLASIEAELRDDARFSVPVGRVAKRPVLTFAIAIVLLIAYMFELEGGSTDAHNLVDLGALVLVTEEYLPAGWHEDPDWSRLLEGNPHLDSWRVITAGFLHFGPVHLLMNLGALLLLGIALERVWSRGRFLACYVTAMLGSSWLLQFLEHPAPDQPVLVFAGASGAIMGLLGALFGRLLIGWLIGSSRAVRRQLLIMVGIVALQTVFDVSVEQVSSKCHLLGLWIGLLFGIGITLTDNRRGPER